MNRIKNTAIEFHDSEVSTIELDSDSVVVKFSAAYVHLSEGRPGIDIGLGFLQAVEVRCSDARVLAHDDGCTGRISDGSFVVDGNTMKMVPVPFESAGESRLDLVFANGSQFSVEGSGIIVSVAGEAKFVERFSC